MKSTLIVAHRGLSSLYPENTLISFKEAVRLGVDMIELDVHQTKDKKLVVIHDDILDRTTEGHGRVCELTLSEIKKYSAGKWFSTSFKKERVPTLKEVFELIKKRTKLLIEIKQPGIEKKLVNLIQQYDMTDNVICGSFYLKSVAKVKKLNPSIPVAFITGSLKVEQIKDLLIRNINMIDIEFHNLTLDLLRKCHSYGFVVNAWNIDEEKDMKKFLEIGVDAICTNYPQRLKMLMRKEFMNDNKKR